MWTRALLKQNGRIAFQRNYWACVAAAAITMLMYGGFSVGGGSGYTFREDYEQVQYGISEIYAAIMAIPFYLWIVIWIAALVGFAIGLAISVLVSNVALIGNSRYFLENREHKTPVGQVFYGFQNGRYSTNVWVMFLRTLYIFLWSLLFIIPGIVKSYSYMLVPYILAENAYLDRKRVFELSSQMMYGHKWEAFVLGLSFLGWNLLGALTGGLVNIFFTNPYLYATRAEFYCALKAEARMKGILSSGELPDSLIEAERAEEDNYAGRTF